jgi:hypothetical protein
MPGWLLVMQQQASKPRPLAGRTISVSASLDHPTRFSYDPAASYDGDLCILTVLCGSAVSLQCLLTASHIVLLLLQLLVP